MENLVPNAEAKPTLVEKLQTEYSAWKGFESNADGTFEEFLDELDTFNDPRVEEYRKSVEPVKEIANLDNQESMESDAEKMTAALQESIKEDLVVIDNQAEKIKTAIEDLGGMEGIQSTLTNLSPDDAQRLNKEMQKLVSEYSYLGRKIDDRQVSVDDSMSVVKILAVLALVPTAGAFLSHDGSGFQNGMIALGTLPMAGMIAMGGHASILKVQNALLSIKQSSIGKKMTEVYNKLNNVTEEPTMLQKSVSWFKNKIKRSW